MSAHYTASHICHLCFVKKDNFLNLPSQLGQNPRRDRDNFIQHATKAGEKSTLVACYMCVIHSLACVNCKHSCVN